jgi:hypothetical protein
VWRHLQVYSDPPTVTGTAAGEETGVRLDPSTATGTAAEEETGGRLDPLTVTGTAAEAENVGDSAENRSFSVTMRSSISTDRAEERSPAVDHIQTVLCTASV